MYFNEQLARYLDNLLERDECSKDEPEAHETASPTIFTEACTNGNYVEVQQPCSSDSG